MLHSTCDGNLPITEFLTGSGHLGRTLKTVRAATLRMKATRWGLIRCLAPSYQRVYHLDPSGIREQHITSDGYWSLGTLTSECAALYISHPTECQTVSVWPLTASRTLPFLTFSSALAFFLWKCTAFWFLYTASGKEQSSRSKHSIGIMPLTRAQ